MPAARSRKTPNCTPGKSYPCTRPDGSQYCNPQNKKCRLGKGQGGISEESLAKVADLAKEVAGRQARAKKKPPAQEVGKTARINIDDFRLFVEGDMYQYKTQIDPNAVHNQDYAQAANEAGGVRNYPRYAYEDDIRLQINLGLVPSEKALKNIALDREEIQQLEQNKVDMAPILEKGKAFEKLEHIGIGAYGEVYSDGTLAYKRLFENPLSPTEVNNLKAAGDLGIAPKLVEVSKDRRAFSMELLGGYKVGVSQDPEYTVNLLRQIKTAHDADYLPDDLHRGNIMFHPISKMVMLIDQSGIQKSPGDRKKAAQLLKTEYTPSEFGMPENEGLWDVVAKNAQDYATKMFTPQKKLAYEKLRRDFYMAEQGAKQRKTYRDLVRRFYDLFEI